MALYERKSKFIAAVANALSVKGTIENRYDLYKDIKKEHDFKLMRARGIYVFNSITIDKGEDLDKYLDAQASDEDRRNELSKIHSYRHFVLYSIGVYTFGFKN